MYGYEWTKEYGIFRLTIDAKIQKEIFSNIIVINIFLGNK